MVTNAKKGISHILHYNTFKTTKFLQLYFLMIDKVALIDIMVILWILQFLFELLLIILYYISRIFLPWFLPEAYRAQCGHSNAFNVLGCGRQLSINAFFYGSIIWHTSIRCFFLLSKLAKQYDDATLVAAMHSHSPQWSYNVLHSFWIWFTVSCR